MTLVRRPQNGYHEKGGDKAGTKETFNPWI
jgi:hypothetical protein